MNILALQYPDSGKLSTDVLDVDTGIDWLVYPARYSQQCQAQSHFVVRSRLDIVENTEIMVGPNQSFYRGTLRPDCRPFRAGIFINTPEPKKEDPENMCPKLDAYKPLIDQWLLDDRKAPRKQRHTAKRVFNANFAKKLH